QALPLDLNLSPADLYRRIRHGKIRFVPFGEFRGLPGDRVWERVATLVQLAGLYLPVGLLAANLPGRFWRSGRNLPRVFAAAVGLAVGLEAIQLAVHSRTPSATDAVVGAIAATAAWM